MATNETYTVCENDLAWDEGRTAANSTYTVVPNTTTSDTSQSMIENPADITMEISPEGEAAAKLETEKTANFTLEIINFKCLSENINGDDDTLVDFTRIIRDESPVQPKKRHFEVPRVNLDLSNLDDLNVSESSVPSHPPKKIHFPVPDLTNLNHEFSNIFDSSMESVKCVSKAGSGNAVGKCHFAVPDVATKLNHEFSNIFDSSVESSECVSKAGSGNAVGKCHFAVPDVATKLKHEFSNIFDSSVESSECVSKAGSGNAVGKFHFAVPDIATKLNHEFSNVFDSSTESMEANCSKRPVPKVHFRIPEAKDNHDFSDIDTTMMESGCADGSKNRDNFTIGNVDFIGSNLTEDSITNLAGNDIQATENEKLKGNADSDEKMEEDEDLQNTFCLLSSDMGEDKKYSEDEDGGDSEDGDADSEDEDAGLEDGDAILEDEDVSSEDGDAISEDEDVGSEDGGDEKLIRDVTAEDDEYVIISKAVDVTLKFGDLEMDRDPCKTPQIVANADEGVGGLSSAVLDEDDIFQGTLDDEGDKENPMESETAEQMKLGEKESTDSEEQSRHSANSEERINTSAGLVSLGGSETRVELEKKTTIESEEYSMESEDKGSSMNADEETKSSMGAEGKATFSVEAENKSSAESGDNGEASFEREATLDISAISGLSERSGGGTNSSVFAGEVAVEAWNDSNGFKIPDAPRKDLSVNDKTSGSLANSQATECSKDESSSSSSRMTTRGMKRQLSCSPAGKKKNARVRMKKKEPPSVENSLYFFEGKDFRRVKFPEFQPWCTDEFYESIIDCMRPKFGLEANKRAVNLMKYLSVHAEEACNPDYDYQRRKTHADNCLHILAKAGLVKNLFEFHVLALERFPPAFFNMNVPRPAFGPRDVEWPWQLPRPDYSKYYDPIVIPEDWVARKIRD